MVSAQPNPAKEQRARELADSGGVVQVEWSSAVITGVVSGPMLSARVRTSNHWKPEYVCRIFPYENITCECCDFRFRGGQCKHVSAAFIEVSSWDVHQQTNASCCVALAEALDYVFHALILFVFLIWEENECARMGYSVCVCVRA